MRLLNKFGICLSAAIIVAGCGSTEPSEKVQHSGFLSDYTQLKNIETDDDSITTKYQSSKANLSQYKKVIIEPINYYPSAPTDKQIPKTVQDKIESYIEKMMLTTFDKKYEVTSKAGADTFKLRFAITGLTVDDEELSGYQYIPISFLVTAASGGLNDMSVKIKVESEAVDSQSGEVISAFTKLDSGETLDNEDAKVEFKHIEPLLKKWFKSLDKIINK